MKKENTPGTLNRGVERTQAKSANASPVTVSAEIRLDYFSMTFQLAEASELPSVNRAFPVEKEEKQVNQESAKWDQFRSVAEIQDWLNTRAWAWDSEAWRDAPGRYGYARAVVHASGVWIHYAGRQGMGVHVEIGGSALRGMEQGGVEDWQVFIDQALAHGARVGRMDVAMDDRHGVLSVRHMQRALERGHVATHFRQFTATTGDQRIGAGAMEHAQTLYVGQADRQKHGDSLVCIYNKQVERIAKGHADPGAWIRVELRTYRQTAHELAKRIADLGMVFVVPGAIKGKLDFKTPLKTDSNVRRWKTVHWWEKFLATAAEVYLTPPTPTATIDKKFAWLDKTASKNLAMVLQAYPNNPKDILYVLMRTGESRFTARDRELIAKARKRSGVA